MFGCLIYAYTVADRVHANAHKRRDAQQKHRKEISKCFFSLRTLVVHRPVSIHRAKHPYAKMQRDRTILIPTCPPCATPSHHPIRTGQNAMPFFFSFHSKFCAFGFVSDFRLCSTCRSHTIAFFFSLDSTTVAFFSVAFFLRLFGTRKKFVCNVHIQKQHQRQWQRIFFSLLVKRLCICIHFQSTSRSRSLDVCDSVFIPIQFRCVCVERLK